jgi:hypothetical protein
VGCTLLVYNVNRDADFGWSGADRDRTGDPLLAKQVLSQLSYRPGNMERQQVSQPAPGPGVVPGDLPGQRTGALGD